jgi:hypothetical protein
MRDEWQWPGREMWIDWETIKKIYITIKNLFKRRK